MLLNKEMKYQLPSNIKGPSNYIGNSSITNTSVGDAIDHILPVTDVGLEGYATIHADYELNS
jgi:hypothetical protein